MNPAPITGISSMATRGLLSDLSAAYARHAGVDLAIEAVGGVDAARRIAAGEAFDLVVLSSDAIAKLAAGGHVQPGSSIALVRSLVAIAVRQGNPHPDVSTELALREAVLAARRVGYSTGPSGVALVKLFERWGIVESLNGRLVQAPPGVPVGSLVARGEVDLGFQQLSELLNLPGIELIGLMPEAAQIVTVFSGAIGARCRDVEAARAALQYFNSAEASDIKRRHGMENAT